MARRGDDEQFHATPTGLQIHEPNFPNIAGDPSSPAQGVDLHLASDGAPDSNMTHHDATKPDNTTSTQNTTDLDKPVVSRPAQQRWATERPKPSMKHSLLGKFNSGNCGDDSAQMDNPATVTFDPYSSDSDSSDDERMPNKSSSHDETLAKEEFHKRREHASPFARLKVANEHFRTSGRISKSDGRLKLSLLEKDIDSGYLAKALGAVLSRNTNNADDADATGYDKRDIDAQKIAPEDDEMEHNPSRRVQLNIVIIIIGSRGDIQPFIRIGKILQDDYGHRVRMATHPAFKDFVEKDCGLEFFSIGGNPAELMAFMVKNPGLIPNLDTIKEGEIGRRRAQMYEMFQGMWRACINATDDETDKTNAKMSTSSDCPRDIQD